VVLLETLELQEKEDLQDSVGQMDHQDLWASVVKLDYRDCLEQQDSQDPEAMMELVDWMDNQVFLDQLVIQVTNVSAKSLESEL